MDRNATGHYVTTAVGGEAVRAFVPVPLPPVPPWISLETGSACWNAPPSLWAVSTA